MGALERTRLASGTREIEYPESDGKPMAETDLHRDEMSDLIAMLSDRYGDRPDVYVSGNLFLYYWEGDPRAVVAPDVFVVFGVPRGARRTYKLWLEGAVPAVVIEVTSRKTRAEDLRAKRDLYARLGIAEYFLHDPEHDYLKPPLQGNRLVASAYQPITPGPDGTVRSEQLGLDLRTDEGRLVLTDVLTGAALLPPREHAEREHARAEWEHRRAERERRRAEAEQARATAAEAEAERLRIELERLRGGTIE